MTSCGSGSLDFWSEGVLVAVPFPEEEDISFFPLVGLSPLFFGRDPDPAEV